MTTADIRRAVLEIIADVAPDADLGSLDPSADLRDALDIDSMDFLNVVIGVHTRLGVEIPEAEQDRVRSVDGLVAFVAARCPARPPA